ncbi:metal-independent alpha-mannosidase [Sphingomonas lenta]|uniref:Metal-independent alpha-mannosidase n=2 Tax=Sphingomonas lenta TaxID=1141887 RepID=A0A2A2SDX7_9SPHN|nr:metal-independent alpha-mannosidase [Sphingomonas lenta]
MIRTTSATDDRPAARDRRFTSDAVERFIDEVEGSIADPELARLWRNCFPNTLDTTITHVPADDTGAPDTFVITGDIPAMWLRDSTAQVWPYLPLASDDPALARLIAGVVRRQARCILLDPYANAFYREAELGTWRDDLTEMRPGVHERKWELDSLAYFLRLSSGYHRATGDGVVFDDAWLEAAELVARTLRVEQLGPFRDQGSTYSFRRLCDFGDSLPNGGAGDPSRACGMVRSAFRPSDDACKLPFLVPANLMAATALADVVELLETMGRPTLATEYRSLAREIGNAAEAHGTVEHPAHGRIWAYEVDGFGGSYLMDDANVPSLLALPYLGVCDRNDDRYRRTRAFCLSADNPYFAAGGQARGVGSPHTGVGTVWPIAITMQALTSDDEGEILACLGMLRSTHDGTGFMHESLDPDAPAKFTRPWFAWANTLFGELIATVYRERPQLLRSPLPSMD